MAERRGADNLDASLTPPWRLPSLCCVHCIRSQTSNESIWGPLRDTDLPCVNCVDKKVRVIQRLYKSRKRGRENVSILALLSERGPGPPFRCEHLSVLIGQGGRISRAFGVVHDPARVL